MTTPPDLPREEIEALMVFLANDTLEGEERVKVEEAVAADPQLQAELEALRRIRTEMQAERSAATPGEFGLARLMRDIDREAGAPATTAAGAEPPRSRIWQLAAAAAVALLAMQTAWFWSSGDDFDVTVAGGEAGDIRVTFVPEASEADIRALLLELNAEIVAGPSALGIYDLDVLEPTSVDAALERLLATPGIVASAELGGE